MAQLKKVFWLCAVLFSQPSLSAPIEGEYDGEFNGYLTVKHGTRSNY